MDEPVADPGVRRVGPDPPGHPLRALLEQDLWRLPAIVARLEYGNGLLHARAIHRRDLEVLRPEAAAEAGGEGWRCYVEDRLKRRAADVETRCASATLRGRRI